MSKFSDMLIEIEEMLVSGRFTAEQVANFFGMPLQDIQLIEDRINGPKEGV